MYSSLSIRKKNLIASTEQNRPLSEIRAMEQTTKPSNFFYRKKRLTKAIIEDTTKAIFAEREIHSNTLRVDSKSA